MINNPTVDVHELELLLHQEVVLAYRDLIRDTGGIKRWRLENELRRLESWVPHWRADDEPQPAFLPAREN